MITADPQVAIHADTPIMAHPFVAFGPEVTGDLNAALRREWLVTNGLGGYASSTIAGANTRRYHGLLVAALNPPVERTVLVAGSLDWATYDGHRYPLSTHEYGDGTIDPHGYRPTQSFELDGSMPVCTFACGDALLEKRVWMAHGANTTYVTYRLLRGSRSLDLEIAPLVTYRDFHSLSRGGWHISISEVQDGIEVHAFEGAARTRCPAHVDGRESWRPGGHTPRRQTGGDPGALVLRPIEYHLRDACLGSVSEILEGDAPRRPVGCVAQAWGVAETLRVLRLLAENGRA